VAGFAVAVAVGPKEEELSRTQDLIYSVAAWERRDGWFIMVDDSPQPRALDRSLRFPATLKPIALHHPRHGRVIIYKKGKGICSAVLLALQAAARQTACDFVLKLDTDSLVIGPFFERITRFFAEHSQVGNIGAYTLTPNGDTRDFARNGSNIRSLHQPTFDWSMPLTSLRRRRDPTLRTIRRHIETAVGNGYQYGEHCLGGGYAISRALLDAMNADGFLDDPALWLAIDCPEDVMAGLYTRAAGFEMANCVGEGEVFGVRHKGLPFDLEELVRRRFAVIHAVKNDPRFPEEQVREFFRSRRPVV
jgi:hypothetical protein